MYPFFLFENWVKIIGTTKNTLPKTYYVNLGMPHYRNFLYWIDKRRWKYIFLLATLELSGKLLLLRGE